MAFKKTDHGNSKGAREMSEVDVEGQVADDGAGGREG